MALVSATGLTLFYGHMEVFSGVGFELGLQSHVGIVGPNGTGKTSLLRLLVGAQEADAGALNLARGLRVGYVPQVLESASARSLHEEIMAAFDELRALEQEVAEAGAAMDGGGEAAQRYADLEQRFEVTGGYTYQSTFERTVAGLGLSQKTLATPMAAASGGERTRAAMAKALLAEPDLLVLDEPTNHLDLTALAWLERFLANFKHAFVVVSHDRYFLDRVITETWELENGTLSAYPGNYSRYRELKSERDERRRREYAQQQEYVAKEEAFIRRYRAGQKAQQAQGRATRLARLERMETPTKQMELSLSVAAASRTAHVALATKELRVGYARGGHPVRLVSVPNLTVERGARIAILGANGAGKTTLLRALLGTAAPLAGTVQLGGNVQAGYYRQGLEDLPVGLSVLEALRDVQALSHEEARSYLARFLFRGDDVEQVVNTLSGGQRSRLALARLLITRPNLLVLDEPTNHLDIPSREALEEVLQEYSGTFIFVSHDRHLIALLAQQIWVVENGKLSVFRGAFSEWEARQAAAAEQVAKARPTTPRAARPREKGAASSVKVDFEQAIAEIEARLRETARELQAAAERQDVAAVVRLGGQHASLETELEAKWAAWADGARA